VQRAGGPAVEPARPAASAAAPRLVRAVGALAATALVVGNMVGTSVYTLPATIADTVGPIGLVSWVVTALGYFFVALVYAALGVRYPRTGGPYAFAREAFGDFWAFQSVWAYYASAIVGNAAIVTGVVGYAAGLSPWLAARTGMQVLLALALVWGTTALNVIGVKQGARAQVVLVALNIVPLVVVCALSLSAFDAKNLVPFAPHGVSSIAAGAALVVWAYSGVESATVPAEEVKSPERTIGRATIAGYVLGTVVFMLIAVAVTGGLSRAEAAASPRPIALLAAHTLGPGAALAMSLAAVVAGTGTLNGWVLMTGRIPLAAAEDGLFFPALARLHPRFVTPHVALVAGAAATSAMLLLYFRQALLGVFEIVALVAIFASLIPHVFTAAAYIVLARRDRARFSAREGRRALVVGPAALVFLVYAAYGVGARALLLAVPLALAGVPLYFLFRSRRREA
jgi:APA family basic amino acid/polyamine antiporter